MTTRKLTTAPVTGDLQRLLSLSPAVHYISTASGDYAATFISDGVKGQLGYEPHQFTEDPEFWASHIHPEDLERVLGELGQLNEKQRHSHEYRFRHANGSWRRMYDESVLVRDDAGNPQRIIGSWLDITELSETEVARRESEERYRDLFENVNDLIQSVAPDGSFRYVNPAWLRVLGYAGEELPHLSVWDIVHPDSREYAEQLFERLVAGENIDRVQTRFITRNNQTVHVEGGAICQFEAGRLIAIRSLFHDVTARVLAEASLRSAKEEAERANLVKSRFLVAAGHDLRQPLQSSRLYLSALLRKLQDEGVEDIVHKVELSLGVMQEILDALLDISKLSNGTISVDKHDFALKDVLGAVVSSNLPHAEEKGLGLHVEDADCSVHSDPALLQRVIDNFVANAIRYTEKGSVSLGCSCTSSLARIEVADTGVGIPADAVEHIFDEYVQLDNPVRDRRKGFGLGLSIARQVSQLLGHRLDVTSQVGVGSTFAIEVPLGEVATTQPEPVPENSHSGGRGRVLLFIDDDPAIVESMSIVMEMAGFRIHTAGTGNEALDAITKGLRPDIVVSDYWLPGMTGIEVIRRIRQNAGSAIPAVLMTGDTSTQKIEATDLNDCRVVHKPLILDGLIALIEELTT